MILSSSQPAPKGEGVSNLTSEKRTEYLISSGLKVLRFTNEDVEDRIQLVNQLIINSTIISLLRETGKEVKNES
jgi:very-short-patch-repair endonuclease